MGLRRPASSILLTLALVAVAFPSPAAHGEPVAVTEQRLAFAEFTGRHLDRNHWKWYGAIVFEQVPLEGGRPHRFGGVFRGMCEREKTRDSVSVHCSGRGSGLNRGDSFSLDPAASEARLDVKDGRWHHRVEWAATDDPPGRFLSESACNAGIGYGGGIARFAAAVGHVFGRKYGSLPSFRHLNMLWSGAQVTQCTFLSERDLRDLTDGGGFKIHRSW